ncbi:hypothetical protein ACFVSW_08660 [Neobacillus sp. NPDC058068]|uniref:hypothetical protein n=1 Tax=Neobacillus sp. NPDC058068 TaxID=3346325 RepID=UPI0036DB58F6
MLTTSSYNQLKSAQIAIGKLNSTKPSIYRKFINIIKLTRQLQFGYQYMGSLIMDEDPGKFNPRSQDDYVLSVYYREIENLKTDIKFLELKQLLKTYKQISYANISKLALGENPEALVGPTLVR